MCVRRCLLLCILLCILPCVLLCVLRCVLLSASLRGLQCVFCDALLQRVLPLPPQPQLLNPTHCGGTTTQHILSAGRWESIVADRTCGGHPTRHDTQPTNPLLLCVLLAIGFLPHGTTNTAQPVVGNAMRYEWKLKRGHASSLRANPFRRPLALSEKISYALERFLQYSDALCLDKLSLRTSFPQKLHITTDL